MNTVVMKKHLTVAHPQDSRLNFEGDEQKVLREGILSWKGDLGAGAMIPYRL